MKPEFFQIKRGCYKIGINLVDEVQKKMKVNEKRND